MIQAYPTKNGTGISIFGDYGDLNGLYETVHHIANSLDEFNKFQKGQFKLLMNFAYEIRKAYSGQRLKEKFTYPNVDEIVDYYGFQLVWTDVLIFINVLRHNSGYIQTDKLHQANLYLLEYVVEKALLEYDAQGGNSIKELITRRINILDKYVFLIYQSLHITYVSDKSGKTRFRKIPDLVASHFSTHSMDYKNFINSLEVSAKKQNCDILDLEFSEFPTIKW